MNTNSTNSLPALMSCKRRFGVVKGTARLLEHIESLYGLDDSFTAHDLQEEMELGKVIYDRMKELRQYRYIKIKEPGAGNIATKYCRDSSPIGATGLELPDIKTGSWHFEQKGRHKCRSPYITNT